MTALAPPATSAAAPWRAQFLQQLSRMPMPLCAVSTLHPTADGSPAAGPTTFPTIATPRVRSCVCRGLWGTLPENARNPAPRNPAIYESDLPVFTTDARMAKAWELAASAPAPSGSTTAELGKASANMTGGGGPIEAVWWASESGTQWRMRGTAWVLGPDVDDAAGEAARSAIQKHMRRAAPDSSASSTGSDWSWPREITAHFGNLSPGMRGSFRNPAPGLPRPRRGEEGNTQPGEGMGAPVGNEHLEDPEARANFRVVVIVPEEVDQVDLSAGDDPRRWVYTYVGEDGQHSKSLGLGEDVDVVNGWAKQEVWP